MDMVDRATYEVKKRARLRKLEGKKRLRQARVGYLNRKYSAKYAMRERRVRGEAMERGVWAVGRMSHLVPSEGYIRGKGARSHRDIPPFLGERSRKKEGKKLGLKEVFTKKEVEYGEA